MPVSAKAPPKWSSVAANLGLVRHAVTASPQEGFWAIEAVDPEAAPLLRRLETPLAGRERELEQIADAFERAAMEGRARLP